MSYVPDILIVAPETGDVVGAVEVKGRLTLAGDRVAAGLFEYLRASGGSIALLVTADSITIFRDRTLAPDPASMDRLGPLPLAGLFEGGRAAHAPKKEEAASVLEDRVALWLEDLAAGYVASALPNATREALEREVLPWIRGTQVRFSPPRRAVSA